MCHQETTHSPPPPSQRYGNGTNLEVPVGQDTAVQSVVDVSAARRINAADTDPSQVEATSKLLVIYTLHAGNHSSILHRLYLRYIRRSINTQVLVTEASMLRVRVHGTVCHPDCIRTSATNSLSDFSNHFYLGVCRPRHMKTICLLCLRNFLTNQLTIIVKCHIGTGHVGYNEQHPSFSHVVY